MKLVELYARVRYAVRIEGLSRREAARRFGIDPRTVAKMLSFSVPPGYRRQQAVKRPKLWSARLEMCQWIRETLDKESIWDEARSTNLSRW